MSHSVKRVGAATPLSSAAWVEFFRINAQTPTPVDWAAAAAALTAEERAAVASSVAEFQLGESSEGANLLRFGRHYAEASGDAAYYAALRLFIGEEHRHARDLGRFMDLAGLPRLADTWADSVFRFLRRRAGLEVSIAVLVTAEVIATVYYDALRAATASPLLRGLCDRILTDEAHHVRFQCERLAILRARRGSAALAATAVLHRLLMAGACVVVWRGHRRALRRGGYGFVRFWLALRLAHGKAIRLADPRRYKLKPTSRRIADHPWWVVPPAAASMRASAHRLSRREEGTA
jgi:hypothetical protein